MKAEAVEGAVANAQDHFVSQAEADAQVAAAERQAVAIGDHPRHCLRVIDRFPDPDGHFVPHAWERLGVPPAR